MYPAATLALTHNIDNIRVDDRLTLALVAQPKTGTVVCIATENEGKSEVYPISATRALIITKAQLKELQFSVAILVNRHIPRKHLLPRDRAITVLAVVREWCCEEKGFLKQILQREMMKLERIEKRSTLINEIPKVRDRITQQLWILTRLRYARDEQLFKYDPKVFQVLLAVREKDFEYERRRLDNNIRLFLGKCKDYGSYLTTYQFVKFETNWILECLKTRQEEINNMDLYDFNIQENVDKDAQLFLFTALAILDRIYMDECDKRARDNYQMEEFNEKVINLKGRIQRYEKTIASIDAIELQGDKDCEDVCYLSDYLL